MTSPTASTERPTVNKQTNKTKEAVLKQCLSTMVVGAYAMRRL
jgi:hypothetical protein